MPTCKEVSRWVASDELEAAGWSRRLAVRLHLLMCRHCRRYVGQIRAIGEASRRLFADEARQDPETSERLRRAIVDRLAPSTAPAHPEEATDADPDSRV